MMVDGFIHDHYIFTGNGMDYHRNQKFSTLDVDNDKLAGESCAALHCGGWWFNECDACNLNGKYGVNSNEGLEWQTWVESKYTLKKAEMKIKPFM